MYLTPAHVKWWNRGGRLKGESPARIAFLRKLMESGPDRGIDPEPDRAQPYACGTKGEGWVLVSTGVRQPIETEVRLAAGKRYRLTHMDPRAKTMTPAGLVTGGEGLVMVPLTGRPHMAFLLEAEG